MLNTLLKAYKLLSTAFHQTAILPGISDILVTHWQSGEYKSTPFIVCFGYKQATIKNKTIAIEINGNIIKSLSFTLDQFGYLQPMYPSNHILSKFNLLLGKNIIKFILDNYQYLSCEIYLFNQSDQLLISDLDGTLTKSDLSGFYNNLCGENYLHQGYAELIDTVQNHGYKVVWLTMRSISLYAFTKSYIKSHIKIQGALLTQPQQFFNAMKKQLTKKTGNIKANMMRTIRNIFPPHIDPFIGGLGNREQDAIAYRAAGVSYKNIYLIDTTSKVHRMNNTTNSLTYKHMSDNFSDVFSSHLFNRVKSKSDVFQDSTKFKKNQKNSKSRISLKNKVSQKG